MDALSLLDPLAWKPEYLKLHPAYAAGQALACLYRGGNKQASTNYPLSGRLYLSKSGWLLLSVPNALVRGVFDAMNEPGAELPTSGVWGLAGDKDLVNAHVSVMTADEVQQVGANKINERGHMFAYALGPMKDIAVSRPGPVGKVWLIQIVCPALSALRKSYGLPPLPNDDHPFHITIAVRRKHVLGNNDVSKGNNEDDDFDTAPSRGELKAAASKDVLPGGAADHVPDNRFDPTALAEGAEHEQEHTRNDQVAKEIAKDHLSEDPAYYQKVRVIEPPKRVPSIIQQLRQAKQYSDTRQFAAKNDLLRRLMAQAPQDWVVDDARPKFKGVTHTPTKFRFHADPSIFPPGMKLASGSVYGNQLVNSMTLRQPLVYNPQKPVFENIRDHLAEVKRRGDFQMQARRNAELYQTAIDPQYRYQRAMQAMHNTLPKQRPLDEFIENHGDRVLGMLGLGE